MPLFPPTFLQESGVICVRTEGSTTCTLESQGSKGFEQHRFIFDRVFDMLCTQEEVYGELAADVVDGLRADPLASTLFL